MPNGDLQLTTQLLHAGAAAAGTAFIHALFIAAAAAIVRGADGPARGALRLVRDTLVLVVLSLWLTVAHGLGIGLWGVMFERLEIFDDLETALYFAAASYTTLGFGDVLAPRPWRLLSGACGASGLLMFGLSAAFLFEATAKLRLTRPH
ncbi:MAG: ion channel [Pseudomonadota bacterium]